MKIIFISHDATRTGAPILLLRLIEQIKLSTDFEILILLKNGGKLQEDFEKLGKTFVWNRLFEKEKKQSRLINFLNRLTKSKNTAQTKQVINKIEIFSAINGADFIFNNTIANVAMLKQLPLKGKKVLSYFHELHAATQLISSKEEVSFLSDISEKIFVPSEAVRNFFVSGYNISEEKIAILKYIIPEPKTISRRINSNGASDDDKKNHFIVGLCGTIESRKGFDLVPLIIKKIVKEKKILDIHFIWIGADLHSLEYFLLKNDLRKLGIEAFFSATAPVNNIEWNLSQLDLFLLPSREDAFPLVVLEAAYQGLPCIYFTDSGGIKEFSGNDAGVPIDYLDIDQMVKEIVHLKTNDQLRITLGERAKEKITEYSNHKKIIDELLKYFQ